MEKEELKRNIMKYIEAKKKRTITFKEIYDRVHLPYSPESTKIVSAILEELVKQNKIQQVEASKNKTQNIYEKYRIISLKQENQQEIKQEIIKKLHPKIDISYYLKHPEEYEKEKDFIIQISDYLNNPSTELLTVNERSYQIFRKEKLLKQKDGILKKIGLKYEDLYAYDTYEPFFYYNNPNHCSETKQILIIENKDTFWTIKRVLEERSQPSKIALLIYGEGKKILNSFSYIENFNLSKKEDIYYFGDIDYEGIHIYLALKKKYEEYLIKAYVQAYEIILDNIKDPGTIPTKQMKEEEDRNEFLKEFKEKEQQKLKYLWENNKYIPQEAFYYEVAKKVIK